MISGILNAYNKACLSSVMLVILVGTNTIGPQDLALGQTHRHTQRTGTLPGLGPLSSHTLSLAVEAQALQFLFGSFKSSQTSLIKKKGEAGGQEEEEREQPDKTGCSQVSRPLHPAVLAPAGDFSLLCTFH